jgi:hypothetical protein
MTDGMAGSGLLQTRAPDRCGPQPPSLASAVPISAGAPSDPAYGASMRPIAAAAALLATFTLHGAPLAILGKDDVVSPDHEGQLADVAKARFLQGFRAELAGPRPWSETRSLENPPSWGKTISAKTAGVVAYQNAFKGGFVCHLALESLEPKHRYILTLNGNPQKSGNDLLPDPVSGNPREKYYDFLFVETDEHGSYAETLGVFLQPGEYDVRLYVKDTADFKIVLYRDFFRFTVE